MLAPKSVFITGTNRGLGLELVKQFLTLETPPKYIFAACRNPVDAVDLDNLAKQNPSLSVLPLGCFKHGNKMLKYGLKSRWDFCAAIHPGWIKTDMGTDKAPLTIEQGGKIVINALEQLKGEEMTGVLYSAPKLEVISF